MNPQWNFAKGLWLGKDCRAEVLLQSSIEGSSFAAVIVVQDNNFFRLETFGNINIPTNQYWTKYELLKLSFGISRSSVWARQSKEISFGGSQGNSHWCSYLEKFTNGNNLIPLIIESLTFNLASHWIRHRILEEKFWIAWPMAINYLHFPQAAE